VAFILSAAMPAAAEIPVKHMTQLSMLYSGVHVGRLYIEAELHKLLQAAESRLRSQCRREKSTQTSPLYTDCGGVSEQLAVITASCSLTIVNHRFTDCSVGGQITAPGYYY
jgi:hypothetical protein